MRTRKVVLHFKFSKKLPKWDLEAWSRQQGHAHGLRAKPDNSELPPDSENTDSPKRPKKLKVKVLKTEAKEFKDMTSEELEKYLQQRNDESDDGKVFELPKSRKDSSN